MRIDSAGPKGLGIFANRLIRRGELVFAEKPMLLIHRMYMIEDEFDSDASINKNLHRYFISKLSKYEKKQFYSLSSQVKKGKRRKDLIRSIINNNNFGIGDDHLGIFDKISRINHSCKPNVNYYWNDDEQAMYLYAVSDIRRDEELYISYIVNYKSKKMRMKKLKNNYGFDCECAICSIRNETKSKLIDKKLKIVRKLLADPVEFSEKSMKKLEDLIDVVNNRFTDADEANIYKELTNDSFLIGELNFILFKYLRIIEKYLIKYKIKDIANYAFTNLSVAYGWHGVSHQYPDLVEHLFHSKQWMRIYNNNKKLTEI